MTSIYPTVPQTPSGHPSEHHCLDDEDLVVDRLPVWWLFPWVWSGCVRRTPVPSGLSSIQKDLQKQQSLTTLSYGRFILPIIPQTKGQYQFICLRQRKVANMQLESSTNKSNKSPAVFFLSLFHTLRPPARTRIFFSRQAENTDVKSVLSSATSCNGQ